MYCEITNVHFNQDSFVLTVAPPTFLHPEMNATPLSFPAKLNDFNGNVPSLRWLKVQVVDGMTEAWSSDIWVGANKIAFIRDVREYIANKIGANGMPSVAYISVKAENYATAVALLNEAGLL